MRVAPPTWRSEAVPRHCGDSTEPWRAGAVAGLIGLGGWILRQRVPASLFLRPRDVRVDAGTGAAGP